VERITWCPHPDSNWGFRLRRAALYPLSYGGQECVTTIPVALPRLGDMPDSATNDNEELRTKLRALRVFVDEPPAFDTDAAPEDPLDLFREWLASAIDAPVSQPHAMVLATADASGVPSARTLLLKDVTHDGFWFASLSSSPKGRDLAENPHCALTLYWREQGRQIRITGTATPGPREVSERDFLARHPLARAGAIAGAQSEPIVDEEAAKSAAAKVIASDDSYVPADWHAYRVEPDLVEFWQSGPDREQTRLRYRRENSAWNRAVIWP
jgi:pyridoxamine 5'-phosphate oxidase